MVNAAPRQAPRSIGGTMNGTALNPTLRHHPQAGAMPSRRIDALVGWFGAVLAIVCALAVAAGAWWLKPHDEAVTSATAVRVADTDLVVPTAWLRSAQVADSVERLDLIIPSSALAEAAAQEDGPVFVTLSRPNGSMDPADRTALLYARFLSAETTPGIAGLIRREFPSGTPYAGEDLLLSPPDERAFAARCFKAAVAAKMKAARIAAFRVNGLDVQIRFAPGVLPHWEALTQGLQRLVEHGA
jgi:hypothetical protein